MKTLFKTGKSWHGEDFVITPCRSGGYVLIRRGKWIAQGPLHRLKRLAHRLFM